MKQAIWNGKILAESDATVSIEGNDYFPANSIQKDFFVESDTKSYCPWKGEASYYSLNVDGETNKDAAWYYPETKELAKSIEGYIAFWKGVSVKEA